MLAVLLFKVKVSVESVRVKKNTYCFPAVLFAQSEYHK